MKGKVIAFNTKSEKLLSLAERYINEKKYYAGLRMLYKKIEMHGGDVADWLFLAETFDDMELYELSINYWYRFLSECSILDLPDAYEGLAACYYNIGNEPQSAYYYNKLLAADKDIPHESKMEIAKMFTRPVSSRYKIVYPPERADYTDDIDSGVKFLREHDYEKARQCFERVHPLSKQSFLAKNYLAVCHLVTGKTDEAERECLEILENNPEDIQALATYCALLVEKNEPDKAKEVAKQLCNISTDNPDELYKIATVCCESGLHAEAFEKFSILEQTVKYDITLLYFKAVAAFKSEKYDESLNDLSKILSIFPQAEVVRFYYNELRGFLEGEKEKPSDMNYFYKVPAEERLNRVKLLAILTKLKKSELKEYAAEFDLVPLLRWCFDEFDGQEPEFQMLAVKLAIKADEINFIYDMLLDSTVNDVIKMEALKTILERNRRFSFCVVVCDVFRKMDFLRVAFGKEKRKLFISAYVQCVIRFCVLGEDDCEIYADSAEFLYSGLKYSNALSIVTDEDSLACAMYIYGTEFKDVEKMAAEFHTDITKVNKILNVIREVEKNYETD